jgi:hypothetical protein
MSFDNISRMGKMKSMAVKTLVVCFLLFAYGAPARDIDVKFHDDSVNVDNGNFVEMDLISSSLVKEIFYDESNQYLLVRVKNTFYHYCNIPQKYIHDWIHASSLGRYYTDIIKGDFGCIGKSIPYY